jgi:two-component system response regulator AtoC
MGLSDPIELQPEAMQSLLAYNWPGNVRELNNVVARSLILSENGSIDVSDLPQNIGLTQYVLRDKNDNEYHTLKQQLRNYQLAIINTAIDEAGGDRRLAANRLGIGVSSLYRKLDMKTG